MTEDSEWTTVHSRASRRRNPRQHPHPPTRRASSPETPRPRTTNLRPLATLQAEYEKIRTQWQSSPCCTAVRALVRAHIAPQDHDDCTHAPQSPSHSIKSTSETNSKVPVSKSSASINRKTTPPPISKAICLGIGTFDPVDDNWDAKRRTYTQLLAFLTMVDQLETQSPITCYFQDPIFSSIDTQFLLALRPHYQVVQTPQAYALIDANTLLFGVHLYRPVYAAALANRAPAIFVGTPWDVWEEVILVDAAADLANLKFMDKTFRKAAFPQDSHSTAFSSTAAYFRPCLRLSQDEKKSTVEDDRVFDEALDDSDQTATITDQMERTSLQEK